MFNKPEPVTLLEEPDQRAQSFILNTDEIDDEMGHLTLSLGEDETELEESGDALEQLEELAAGLESIQEILAANKHGADATTLRMAKQATQAFAKRADFEMADYSVESIGESVTRRDATRLAMESIGETLKNAYKKFVALMTRLWNAFMDFVDRIFNFFTSMRGRIERLRNRAKQLKAAGATSRVSALPLPSRLQTAFLIKNRPIDPVMLVDDGKFVDLIETFSDAYTGYAGRVMAGLTDYVTKTPAAQAGNVPHSLLALMNAEEVLKRSFKGEFTYETGTAAVHVDIPGNRVVTISTPVVGNLSTERDLAKYLGGMRVRVRPFEIESKPLESIPQLSLDDVVRICDEALRAIAVAQKYKAAANKLNSERVRLLRSVGVLATRYTDGADVVQNPFNALKVSIMTSISRFVRTTLVGGATWITLQKKLVLEAADVAYIATRQYGRLGEDAEGVGSNPFATASITPQPLLAQNM